MKARRDVCRHGLALWAAMSCPSLAAGAAGAAPGRPPIRVGASRPLQRIADAARLAMDGDVIEIDAGDYAADVAVWDREEITLRGVGGRVRLLAAGAAAEAKAIWVVRRGRVTVENIDFEGTRVRDRNGAGIRHESGQLLVRHCRFIDNENGILTGNHAQATLQVEFSEFGHNGAGDGYSHGLYVGAIASFRLTGCHVHHGQVGHLVKSRARVNRVEYNRLADGVDGRASYELEFPNGGRAEVVGNVIQQSASTENLALVSFGAEGYEQPRNELALVHNTLVNNHRSGGSFVRIRRGAPAALLYNNLFAGKGRTEDVPSLEAAGNRFVELGDVEQTAEGDFRLAPGARRSLPNPPLAALSPAHAALLALTHQYHHPLSTRRLTEPPRWPGAIQSP